jgi:manganese/iron transport system permease protein
VHWLTDPFELEFMRRALLAGLLTVALTSVVGTWVVIRGLTFMGDALAHGVLPGLALASLWGIDLTAGAVAGAVVMVAGVHLVQRRSRLGEDTAIGLLFVGMLAAGVIILSKSRSFTGDLTTFLFGDVLGVTRGDLVLEAVALAVGVAVAAALHRPFLALAFNVRTAELLGLRPRGAHLAMLALIALTVVSSLRAVGTLLVFGLLVGPPATAALFARRVPTVMLGSLVAGVVSVVAGLLISYHQGTAAGASMAAVAVALFFVALVVQEVVAWWRTRSVAAPTA